MWARGEIKIGSSTSVSVLLLRRGIFAGVVTLKDGLSPPFYLILPGTLVGDVGDLIDSLPERMLLFKPS